MDAEIRRCIDRRRGCGYDLRFVAGVNAYKPEEWTDMMDKQKLEHFRKLLETRRLNLRESVARTEEDGRAAQSTDSAQDIADRASSSYQKEFLFARSNNDRQFLQMVEHALSNMTEGTYGECEQCGKEINERRMEAVPWARHCIGCQEKLERGELEPQAQEN
jgi:DnaK suppressor protein